MITDAKRALAQGISNARHAKMGTSSLMIAARAHAHQDIGETQLKETIHVYLVTRLVKLASVRSILTA